MCCVEIRDLEVAVEFVCERNRCNEQYAAL